MISYELIITKKCANPYSACRRAGLYQFFPALKKKTGKTVAGVHKNCFEKALPEKIAHFRKNFQVFPSDKKATAFLVWLKACKYT